MKKFNKMKVASAIGTAALVTALAAPVNAAVVLGGENGWEVSYGGFINLFYTQSDWEFAGGTDHKSSHLQEGLLPSFHTMTAKSPEVGGLRGTAQITFAVDASGNKDGRLNKNNTFGSGSFIDMREVFFNVEGSFGTISAGRTLSLFQRQAILKDYTLFGMGAIVPPADGSGTGLGRIGFGYVYPDFRTRFSYKTPDMNGFQLEVGIFDPQEPAGSGAFASETDTPQFQAEATYNAPIGGGSISAWAGVIWQDQELQLAAGTADSTTFGYNVGIDVTVAGFNIMGSYYGGEALGTLLFNTSGTGDQFNCNATTCEELDADGYIGQVSYTINGKTKIGLSYGQSNEDGDATFGTVDLENTLYTVGVYHDVNSWLKLIVEYGNQEMEAGGVTAVEGDIFSVGGFMLW